MKRVVNVFKISFANMFHTVIILKPRKHMLSVHPTTSTRQISFKSSSVRVIKLQVTRLKLKRKLNFFT